MEQVSSMSEVVHLFCILPNEWKVHPKGVTKLLLVEELRSHLQAHKTTEGLVVSIDDIEARSQHHYNSVWFRKLNGDEVEPDLMSYYTLEIQFFKVAQTSSVEGMKVAQ